MYPSNIVEMLKSSKCPLWQKSCDKVCPSCKWFKKVSGKNPNTGRDIEDWDCAISWMPLFQMDATLAARSGAAATENLCSEVVKRSDEARAQQRLIKAPPVHLIEGSQG